MENILEKDAMTQNEVDSKINEYENALKNGEVTWHNIEEMNDFVDKVISKNV